jgi:hypothetical protein
LPRFLAGLAEDGEQNCCQDRNYSDHDQQLNQREAVTATRPSLTEKGRPSAIGLLHHDHQPPCVGFAAFSAVAVILAHGGGHVKPPTAIGNFEDSRDAVNSVDAIRALAGEARVHLL